MMQTDATLRLLRDFPAERVWLAYQAPPATDFDVVARSLGLRPLGDGWTEVRAHRAEQFLTHLLCRGLAYRERRLADDPAAQVARELARSCGTEGTRYAVNAEGPEHTGGGARCLDRRHGVHARRGGRGARPDGVDMLLGR
ncbi:hypothetical protein [Luteimicrobium subarcticum]|uniref:hypothetical protein n=1 Tax=Luteimicrobium subarcticum TaxID=620910 RepID=UPI0012FE1243|nr:hypothetical protein [Luteimicrobium subarcticum]